jgi:hypothetical protein
MCEVNRDGDLPEMLGLETYIPCIFQSGKNLAHCSLSQHTSHYPETLPFWFNGFMSAGQRRLEPVDTTSE